MVVPGTSSQVIVSRISSNEDFNALATSVVECSPQTIRWNPVRQPNGEQSITPSRRSRSKLASKC